MNHTGLYHFSGQTFSRFHRR